MKTIFTLLTFTYLSTLALGQAPNYDDLKILYADMKYEKLAKVASSYTEKDKSSKHILPYIWLSKGLYKISLSGNTNPKFKNAYKDAIKYLSKGIKYDLKYNDGATFQEEHQEFLEDFQLSLQELIDNEMTSGSVKRTFSWAMKYQKITLNPVGANYVMGACKFLDQDKASARTYWKKADEMMAGVTSIKGFSEADRNMLKNGVISTAESMMKSRQNAKAESLLNKVTPWFEDDNDWQERSYNVFN